MSNVITHTTAEFGTFRYSWDSQVAFEVLTVPLLRARVRQYLPDGDGQAAFGARMRRARKADLVAMVAGLWEAKSGEPLDESVNDNVNGTEIAQRWLRLPANKRNQSVEQIRNDCANYPSPMREYQCSQEMLVVLDKHLAEQKRLIDPLSPADATPPSEVPGDSVWTTVTIVDRYTKDAAGWLDATQALDVLRAALGDKLQCDSIQRATFDGDWNVHLTPEYWEQVRESGQVTEDSAFYNVEILSGEG